ncbi:MAG TPA: pyridoxal phosphate-dependent aminotransferase [Pirellulales bacterium]|jgi:aspartate aminotransferase/aminotransferase|nr:pyridoxal phosphate-dependent aminotransferase [Pirellulales bacterium]
MAHPWIAARTLAFDSSGIRKVFDLAAKMQNPINLSIGQPDFDVPEQARQAAIEAIQSRKNGYAQTQGMPVLRDRLQQQVDRQYGHADRKLFVSSGTSGGLVLAMMTLVNPGDEVLVFDPFFVMYEPLVKLIGGTPVLIDTYPHFRIDLNRVRDAITPRTKLILFNSPANPTGVLASADEVRGLAELAAEKNVALVSDEIYRLFCYDGPFLSPAQFNPSTIVIDGFSKSYAMTGWRLGYVHGPGEIIEQMIKLQQYTFVCAPQPFQWSAAEALEIDMQPHIDAYRKKRDFVVNSLKEFYEIEHPGGAFYCFPKVCRTPENLTATQFVERAIAEELLVIPGKIFSRRDTHFRISYAAADAVLERGVEVLRKMARK